jgi:hypothetical protein
VSSTSTSTTIAPTTTTIDQPTTTTIAPQVAPTTTPSTTPSTLPFTGVDSDDVALVALFALVAGSGLVAMTRQSTEARGKHSIG